RSLEPNSNVRPRRMAVARKRYRNRLTVRRLQPIDMKAFLALVVIIAGFYWKVLTKQYTWMDHPDMAYQILPWYQFQAAEWHRGHFPLWDPHLWGGQPVLGQVVPSGAYPFNWLVFLLPLKDGYIWPLWLNLQFVLTHLMAALFAYWLCRDLGRSRAAS